MPNAIDETYVARMELPTEPSTSELGEIINYLDAHTDSYVDLYSEGPFMVAAAISFVLNNEGYKVSGSPYQLPSPLLIITPENEDQIIEWVEEEYRPQAKVYN